MYRRIKKTFELYELCVLISLTVIQELESMIEKPLSVLHNHSTIVTNLNHTLINHPLFLEICNQGMTELDGLGTHKLVNKLPETKLSTC